MILSQPALVCLEATWQRLLGRGAETEAPVNVRRPLAPLRDSSPTGPGAPVALARQIPDEPSLTAQIVIDAESPLTAQERRARAAALRGLAFSRQRQFMAARNAFVEAARLDPLLDLTRTPGFWKLERGAHEAAIEAYLASGRERDAAVLRARVRSTYRPKPVRPRPEAAFNP